jgi:hypothetical protein
MDQSKWPKGRFSDEPDDPWTPCIELPMSHRENGEAYIFTAQSKTSLAAVKDFLHLCHRKRLEGSLLTIRLGIGSFKGKFGTVKKPVLTILGKSPVGRQVDKQPFNDSIDF